MTGPAAPSGWDAVVLAGGEARRMGGADKARLEVGGSSLLDRVLDAVEGATTRVVVGPDRPTARPVTWCREDPPGGGPAAALAAGLRAVTCDLVVLLAGDLPFLDRDSVHELIRAAVDAGGDGAVAVDADGAPQWLCSAWRVPALRRLDLAAGRSLRSTLGTLRRQTVPVDGRVVLDCDTPDDLRRARELA